MPKNLPRRELLTSGIYAITRLDSQRQYIGSATCLFQRWACHRNRLKTQTHHSPHLQAAWLKYGEQAFEFAVIEFCPKENLTEREQFYIDQLNACIVGFNINSIANSNQGRKASAETRAKMSKARKGHVVSSETREKIAESNRGKVHGPVTEETKAKISANNKAQKPFRLLDKDGVLHEGVNIKKFAESMGLSPGLLASVARGALASHFGWTSPDHPSEAFGQNGKRRRLVSKGPRKSYSATPEHTAAVVAAKAKPYCLIDQDGVLHEGFNLSEFARSRGFDVKCLQNLTRGITASWNGWHCPTYKTEPFGQGRHFLDNGRVWGKPFRLISPEGEVFEGCSVKAFAIERDLSDILLGRVTRGQIPEHRGWHCPAYETEVIDGRRRFLQGAAPQGVMPRGKTFRILDPSGNVIESTNQAKFAETNGLNAVLLGKLLQVSLPATRAILSHHLPRHWGSGT